MSAWKNNYREDAPPKVILNQLQKDEIKTKPSPSEIDNILQEMFNC